MQHKQGVPHIRIEGKGSKTRFLPLAPEAQGGESKIWWSVIRSVRMHHPDEVESGIRLNALVARIAAYGSMRELTLLGNCSESSQIALLRMS